MCFFQDLTWTNRNEIRELKGLNQPPGLPRASNTPGVMGFDFVDIEGVYSKFASMLHNKCRWKVFAVVFQHVPIPVEPERSSHF